MKLEYIVNDLTKYETIKQALKEEFEISDKLIVKLKKSKQLYLNNEPTFIVFGENKQYKVDDNYKTLMKATALFEKEGVDEAAAMIDAIELILGKEAKKEVENMPIGNVRVVFTAVMAAVQGLKYEDAEARFQEQN